MATDVTFAAAATAGVLSFLSPCVLPLVPPYLAFIAGQSVDELTIGTKSQTRRDALFAAALFVTGFASVFVALGATASVFGKLLRANLDILAPAAGAVIIVMGLHFLGVFRIGFLYREKRLEIAKPLGLLGAYVMGLAFAFGWTPCIGPILAAILAVASSQETVTHGASLLAAYSAGLGLPFLGAALAMGPFVAFLRRFKAHLGKVEKIVGVFLIATGTAFLTGGVQEASFWLLQTFPGLAAFG